MQGRVLRGHFRRAAAERFLRILFSSFLSMASFWLGWRGSRDWMECPQQPGLARDLSVQVQTSCHSVHGEYRTRKVTAMPNRLKGIPSDNRRGLRSALFFALLRKVSKILSGQDNPRRPAFSFPQSRGHPNRLQQLPCCGKPWAMSSSARAEPPAPSQSSRV